MAIYVRRGAQRKSRWPWLAAGILGGAVVLYLVGVGAFRLVGGEKRGPVAIELERAEFGQGDMVEVKVYVRDERRTMGEARPTVRVVDEEGREIVGVGGVRGVPVTYDAGGGCWRGRWAVPWGAEGKFRVVAEVKVAKQGTVEAGEASGTSGEAAKVLTWNEGFVVGKAKLSQVPAGLCVATLESLRDYRGARLRGPEGETGNWRVLFDWAEWMGANTLWYSAGWTGSWGERLTEADPWVKSNLEQARLFAAEGKRRGMRFGAWVLAYATHGRRELLPRYEYAWDYDGKKDRCVQTTAISLQDRKRLADIVKLVKELGEDPNVDMVGLDYIRTVKGGYEMVDEFVQEMGPGGLPSGWVRMDRGRRMAWLGKQVEKMKEAGISDQWNWWRARKVRGIVEEVKKRSGLEKPLWVFTLSWQHGMQHGQDPLMMMGAGADLDAVMLYESDRAQYDQLIKDWNAYVRAGEVSVVVGEVVDWDLHQRTVAPAGPEEAYLRARTAVKHILGVRSQKSEVRAEPTVVQGVFWHDLERLMGGRLGPYPSEEWALAGGRAFSELKRDSGLAPLGLSFEIPASAEKGNVFTGRVEVTNEGKGALEKVRVEVVKTVGVKVEGESLKEVGDLPAGGQAAVEFQLTAGGDLRKRGNRVMVGVRCTWEQGGRTEKAITFEYVTVK